MRDGEPILTVPKRSSPWQRRQRRMLFVLALLAGLACAGIIGLQWTAYRARRATEGIVAALAEQGLYVEPARAENAPQTAEDPALAAESAGTEPPPEEIPFEPFALQAAASADISDYANCRYSMEFPARETLSDNQRTAMRKYLADNQGTLRRLHDNALRGRAAIAWGTSLGDPRQSGILFETLCTTIRLLQIEAHVALADLDADTAAAALNAGLVLVKQSASIPSPIKTNWQKWFTLSMTYSIRTAIVSGVMGSEDLAMLQRGFSSLRDESVLRQELQNQLNWGLSQFAEPEQRPWYARSSVDRVVPGFDRLAFSAKKRSGLNEMQRQQYLSDIHQMACIAATAAPERFRQLRRLMQESFQNPAILQGLPAALTRMAIIALREDAEIRAQIAYAVTGLAIERYRIEHGSLPNTLEVLAPDYMSEIPRDPFSDGPLRYRRHDNGFTLGSSGLNGVPNMGQDKNDSESDWNWNASMDMPLKVQYRPDTLGASTETEVQPGASGMPGKTEN